MNGKVEPRKSPRIQNREIKKKGGGAERKIKGTQKM